MIVHPAFLLNCEHYKFYIVRTQKSSGNRPPFLSALCVLTFIGSTAGFLGYFLASLYFDKASQIIIKYSSWHSTEAISPFFFTLLMVFYALSLTGAIRMWKFHRDGFFVYVISQVALVIIPPLWVSWDALSFTNIIFVTVFIIGYGLNLKWMK
jgi:hypothetical protein